MTRQQFENIVPTLIPLIRNTGMKLLNSPADTDDVVQESLYLLWRYCERIDATRNVKGLAVRVAKNVSVDILRKRQADRLRQGGISTRLLDTSPQEHVEAAETQAMVNDAIARLKPRERELFEMRQLNGMTLDEIARSTGVAKSSAKAIISAARWKIMNELKKLLKQ